MNPNQYGIPGGTAEISATVKDLKDAGVVVPTACPFHSPFWPVQKTDGSWGRTVGYRKLNQIVTLITAAGPDVVSLLEQINTSGKWYVAVYLTNAFFLGTCLQEAICFQLASVAIYLYSFTSGIY